MIVQILNLITLQYLSIYKEEEFEYEGDYKALISDYKTHFEEFPLERIKKHFKSIEFKHKLKNFIPNIKIDSKIIKKLIKYLKPTLK